MSAFDPKADILALELFTAAPSDSSEILRDAEDNRRWLRFRNAEANYEHYNRDTPTTA